MTRLQAVWLAIVAFLPLYAAVGAALVERPAAPMERPGALYAALGVLFTVLAVLAKPLLERAGVHSDPASMVAWAAAEAVAIVGLVAWVEAGDVHAFLAGLGVSFALLVLLWPATPEPSRQG